MPVYTMCPRPSACGALQLLLVGLLAVLAVQSTQAQLNPTATATPEGPIKLYLVAAYGPGLVRPATGPTLTAKRLNTKALACQLASVDGVRARATGVTIQSAVAPTLAPQATPAVLAAAARAATTVPPTRSLCAGAETSGRYNLIASYIQGATFPKWNCYPVAPGEVATAALDPAASLPFDTQVVELPAGGTYTCVATYSKVARSVVSAAAAINWDSAAAVATATAAPIIAGACPALRFTPPKRANWAKPLAPLSVRGHQLYANNKPLSIKGINWFGFNVAMGMVDGLWAGGWDYATDFGKITYELKLLGYNAVRLPFTFTQLANTQVWDLVRECKPMNPTQVKQRLIDPNDWAANANKALPANPSNLGNTATGTCNNYLPSSKNEDRLLYVVQQLVNMGMYVVLDYQPMGTEQHAYNLNQFVSSWAALWKKVMCLPNFNSELAGRILVDVMNEPDSMGVRWEAQGDRPGAQQLYLSTADALWAASPANGVRFMFEGTGQNGFGLNWGNGFVTDPQVIQSRGLSDANPFFRALVRKPYVKNGAAIMTPHVYPPTITGNTFLGSDLYSQCNTAFGYLQSQGYCDGGSCTQLPVMVGETGSAMTQATDVQWLHDFADYLNARGQAAQYTKTPVNGWMWWAYNENSGDTGGIVTNQWQDMHWTKLRFMMNKLGLKPWYKGGGGARRRQDATAGDNIVDESGAVAAPDTVAAADVPLAAAAGAAAAVPAATAIAP